MKSGIYCIENLINGKKYIGKTTNITKRWSDHKRKLNNNNHYNTYLQDSWNKYGKKNFNFYIIEECRRKELIEKEIFYISYFDTKNNGYNMTYGGDGLINPSIQTKIKMSINHADVSGKNNPWYGKTPSNETRKKMSNAKKGKYLGKNNPMFGKKHSQKSRIKMSKAKKGKPSPSKEKPKSQEAKRNMSLSHANFSGENNPNAKLKENDILNILNLFYNKKLSQKEILNKYLFTISKTQIYRIIKGECWLDVYKDFITRGGGK
jgi:group I intron endonuclease